MAEGSSRRVYARTVLTGLGSTTLLAVAGAQDWARATDDVRTAMTGTANGSQSAPLVVALGLVGLATWGVVLVVRGTARRGLCVIGVLATSAAFVTALASVHRVRLDARAALVVQGGTGHGVSISLTGWYVVALLSALLALASFLVAWRGSPQWPAMGSRYDAPGERARQSVQEQDLWRSFDEGVDPTTPEGR